MKKIVCENCSKKHLIKSLRRSCANCFLCAGCEIYLCPDCSKEIIITPMRIKEINQSPVDSEDPENKDFTESLLT